MPELKITPLNDVAKPGTTPADATSKPVIVGHEAEVADPMVKPEAAPAPAPSVDPSGSMKSKITPSSSAEEINKDVAEDSDKKLADKATEKTEKDVLDEKQARLVEIIQSGEYNVNVNQSSGTKGAKTFILTVFSIILVAAVLVFFLQDFNVIDTGLKLPHALGKAKQSTSQNSANKTATLAPKTTELAIANFEYILNYDPNAWTYVNYPDVKAGATSSTLTDVINKNSFITVSEFVDLHTTLGCYVDSSCNKDVSDFVAHKLDGIKQRDLYVVAYIKPTISNKYTVSIKVGQFLNSSDFNDPKKATVTVVKNNTTYALDINSVCSTPEGDTQFSSLTDAQNYMKTSEFSRKMAVLETLSGTN